MLLKTPSNKSEPWFGANKISLILSVDIDRNLWTYFRDGLVDLSLLALTVHQCSIAVEGTPSATNVGLYKVIHHIYFTSILLHCCAWGDSWVSSVHWVPINGDFHFPPAGATLFLSCASIMMIERFQLRVTWSSPDIRFPLMTSRGACSAAW